MNNNNIDIDSSLICAYILDGNGGGTRIDWPEILTWRPEQGVIWIHLDYTFEETLEWIRDNSGLSELAAISLLAEETRPRSVLYGDGLQLTLRGVNTNPGSDPEDMVSIRLWIEEHRIISTRRRRLISVSDLRQSLEQGTGPRNSSEFVVTLTEHMVERMADVMNGIDERVDDMEEQVMTAESYQLRTDMARARREAISLRRYLAPQREALTKLANDRILWMTDMDRLRIRELADRTTRYIEDLDAARERAAVIQEELMNRLSEQINKRMYVLSIVAAIFLPLGFLTGLLGINVGGIPGAEYDGGFMIFSGILILVVIFQIWYFRKNKWM